MISVPATEIASLNPSSGRLHGDLPEQEDGTPETTVTHDPPQRGSSFEPRNGVHQ